MKKYLPVLALIFSLFFLSANAQISGIINRYTPVTAIDTCAGRLSVGDTTGFRAGNAVLIIQMQGAEISTGNTAAFGTVTAMNAAGLHERAVIDSVGVADIFVKNRLIHSFNPSGKVQLVSIPEFSAIIVTDTLRAKAWDGFTGGVLALEISGTLTLNAPIVANGVGFRGGADYVALNNGCSWITPVTGYVFSLGNWRGGYKGEGIALPVTGLELGRGPQSSGGGGGNDHNAGGGGGGNVTNGGDGGNNADPNPIGCHGYSPGFGGYGAPSIVNRLFLGGGGGAGHANNLLKSKGGAGGGIVLIKAGAINGASPAISAAGMNAGNSRDDGAGGGGAGGTIRLDLAVPNPNLLLNTAGGRGGSADNANVDRCMGPGGGGAGGRIMTNWILGIFSVLGGAPGLTLNSTDGCNNSNNSAEAGELGEISSLAPLSQGISDGFQPLVLASPLPDTVCPGEDALFTVGVNPGEWTYQWQVNAGAGWQDIVSGSNYVDFQTDSLKVQNVTLAHDGLMFRCKVGRTGCSEVISGSAILQVIPAPTVGFSVSMSGTMAVFTNLSTNASSFFWNFGDGTNSSLKSPVHNYTTEGTFTITLNGWNQCDTVMAQQTISVQLPPTAGFSVPASVIGCGSVQVNFLNLSSANAATFSWSFPGGTPASSTMQNPGVSYTVSGIYTARLIVSNTVGKDTLEKTFEVEIFDLPMADFTWQVFSGGLIGFTNLSQNGVSYTWDFGDGSPQQDGFDIEHDYAANGTYVVTLIVSSPCGASLLQQDVVVQVVGAKEVQQLKMVRLFPNPANGWAMLDWSGSALQPVEIELFNAAGALIFAAKDPSGQSLEISLEGLPAGVYQVLVSFENGRVSRALVKGK